MHPDHELAAFKVTHKKSGTSYYLRAKSASHAIEITTMKLGDAEGRSAWDAVSETPSFPLKHGALCDAAGHIVHTAVY